MIARTNIVTDRNGGTPMRSTVSAGLINGLIAYAVSQGASRDLLLDASRLDSQIIADPDFRVPLAEYIQLMRSAHKQTGLPGLALHFGRDVAVGSHSVVGLIMEAAPTMADAFNELQRYSRLAADFTGIAAKNRFDLVFDNSRLFMVDRRIDPNAFPEMTEQSFASLVCGPRAFLNEPHVIAVHVTHPAPGHIKDYEAIFQCPVHFNAHWNAMELHPDVATWPVARNPSYMGAILARHADELLERLDRAGPTVDALEQKLLPLLHTGAINADSIAKQMNISRQTLFRQLKAEETTFSEVVTDLKIRIARHHLRSGTKGLKEIAFIIGFSEASAFSRAFKRWTGRSPRQYRADEHEQDK